MRDKIEQKAKELRKISIKKTIWDWENLSDKHQSTWLILAKAVLIAEIKSNIEELNPFVIDTNPLMYDPVLRRINELKAELSPLEETEV